VTEWQRKRHKAYGRRQKEKKKKEFLAKGAKSQRKERKEKIKKKKEICTAKDVYADIYNQLTGTTGRVKYTVYGGRKYLYFLLTKPEMCIIMIYTIL